MHLHSKGQRHFIETLNDLKRDKIRSVKNSNIPTSRKSDLINRIKIKFKQLIKESDHSLFIICPKH